MVEEAPGVEGFAVPAVDAPLGRDLGSWLGMEPPTQWRIDRPCQGGLAIPEGRGEEEREVGNGDGSGGDDDGSGGDIDLCSGMLELKEMGGGGVGSCGGGVKVEKMVVVDLRN